MDRLTRRINVSNKADCAYCDNEFDKKGRCNQYCSLRVKQLEKLAAYEDAEEQGRLVMLPCAVGSTVYAIMPIRRMISEMIIDKVTVSDSGFVFYSWRAATKDTIYPNLNGFAYTDLGVCVFGTHEEAETALAAREGE